jgi:hypothetical protein
MKHFTVIPLKPEHFLLLYSLNNVQLCFCFYFFIFVYQDIAGTLATEEAEDAAQVSKLRSALESVDHKRRKVICFFNFLICMAVCIRFI